jgi:hypothetical protein
MRIFKGLYLAYFFWMELIRSWSETKTFRPNVGLVSKCQLAYNKTNIFGEDFRIFSCCVYGNTAVSHLIELDVTHLLGTS